ncbi:formimidoylglutamase [Rummeliibacillus sp. NPDC094406]|uniref:formimidoylglutamase n=1 Tax=Rummeliibacillus sp. NPDC094406 TaxID=3364511 RepID=UPI0038283F78
MYKETDALIWSGRTDSTIRLESFRYHQVMNCLPVYQLQQISGKKLSIIGFECDEGVRRNKGRVGARKAPNEIRKQLASNAWRGPQEIGLYDVGNISCEGKLLEDAQAELGSYVKEILNANSKCIVIGGGHETLYGHYLGVRESVGKESRIGLINIDAHFDLREYDEQISSGTMFKQILDEDQNVEYFVCGIQRYGNTTELFNRADELGVTYLYEDEMSFESTIETVDTFIKRCDVILLTLCADVLSAAHAPGVSATSPFGLEPKIVRNIIRYVCENPKVTSFNICEVNPEVDENNRTVKLGAYLINEAVIALQKGENK